MKIEKEVSNRELEVKSKKNGSGWRSLGRGFYMAKEKSYWRLRESESKQMRRKSYWKDIKTKFGKIGLQMEGNTKKSPRR